MESIKRMIVAVVTAVAAIAGASAAGITVEGSDHKVLDGGAEASTGLEAILVVYNTEGTRLSYRAGSASSRPRWYSWSNMGGGYATELTEVSYDGAMSSVATGSGDSGFMVEDGDRRHCVWVVNYAAHRFVADGLEIDAEQDCDRAALKLNGKADAITYYSINGRRMELSRDLELRYMTLVWDDASESFKQTTASEVLADAAGTIRTAAPLCDTRFELTGDRFLKAWGEEESVESGSYTARAVEAHVSATQQSRDADNEKKDGGEGLGGSAPCEIEFKATVTDAAIFTEWQMSRSAEFEEVESRYSETTLNHTFREMGTTYVRFVCANATGDCEYYSETYTVNVGESALDCPNAFSPGASEGVNDEWRVSYKSIIDFECHIFNRWGTKMATLTDPSQGWDGKYGGKVVPAGVYFYVIKATGADGKEYKLSGDINVINYK